MESEVANKVFPSAGDAVACVFPGATIMFGGFGPAGSPVSLVKALAVQGTANITGISNTVGFRDPLDSLCERRQLKRMIVSFGIRASASRPSIFEELYRRGEIELEVVPQGTLAEAIRAGGAGIPAFCTPTGVGTVLADGKPVIELDGKTFLLERALRADFAFVRAHRADMFGNLTYKAAGRNFNPIMATAADTVIAEVDEIVAPGELDPEIVVTSGLFVDRLVLSESSK